MAKSVSKICRICLEQLGEYVHFYFLNNDNDSMLLSMLLDFLPEIDLDFVQNPISCNRCTITIEQIHEFKKLCEQTESVLKELKKQGKSFDDVVSYVKNETVIETIKEELLEDTFQNEYTINLVESVLKVCRICREQLGENEHFNFLNHENGSMLLSKLLDFFPQIDSDFVQNPISCNRCIITIDRIHEFKKLCVQTESVIKDLKMKRKSFDDIRSHVKEDTEIETIKEELLEDKFKDEPLFVDDDCLEINMDLPICIEVPTKQFFYCYTCNYTTYNKKNLARHVKIHRLQVRQFKCDQCSYTTPNNSSLTAHNRSHQKNSLKVHTTKKSFKCDKCNYCCNQKTVLKDHLHTHTGEKPYKCDICEYCCSFKTSLKKHIKLHTGENLFKCNICDFKSNVNLSRHMRTHTGEKPYKCDICDYSTAQKGTLKVHLLSHTGEKLFNCTKCDYRCCYKSHLNTHMAIHAGEKPYKCDVCHYCFRRKSHLKRHLYTHTKEKP